MREHLLTPEGEINRLSEKCGQGGLHYIQEGSKVIKTIQKAVMDVPEGS